MTSDAATRPDPESFLAAARAEEGTARRGRLKVFLGASPGVGKTFSMLEEARTLRRTGVDVVAALVETHGRAETAALVADLDQIARRSVDYRGRVLTELDLDAVLERRPAVVLIDELAHSNAPGSRHAKRWQDVEEVLDAGIDVMTTLNVQHVESLNDAVARITGIRVRETVPDAVLAGADKIELIDLPPEDLIRRLGEGKVYLPHLAGRALENFFTRAKLTALREMALRTTAGHVDADMLVLMRETAAKGPWPAEERLLVCVNDAPVAKTLVRAAKRMADRAKLPWLVVTVITPREARQPAEAQQATREALRLAEALGAETMTLRAESDAAGEILRFARARNVTRLVVGRPSGAGSLRRRLAAFLCEPVFERLLDGATDFEVTMVAAGARAARRRADAGGRDPAAAGERRPDIAGLGFAVMAVALASLASWPIGLTDAVPAGAITVLYLLAVMLTGARHGLVPSLAASGLGFFVYNFLFTEPYLTFAVSKRSDIVSLMVFLLGALFTGTLASRLKAQIETMRATQARTETLYDFARKIASAKKFDDVLWAAAAHGAKALKARTLILTPNGAGGLEQVQGHPSIEEDLDARVLAAARWAFDKGEPAGAGTGTLPEGDWLFVPLATAGRPFGVYGVSFWEPARAGDPETRRLLLAVEDQVAVAVERHLLADDLARARVAAESDRLRAALLNSVSHDLRTPLVTIIGATSSLADVGEALAPDDRRLLVQSALDEARRLDRYVQNLLDMTRLGHGALKPKRAPVELREIVGRVRADLVRALARHRLVVDIPRDLPMLDVDPVLIGQALANVLDNAAKFAPPDTTITLSARRDGAVARVTVSDEGPGIEPADRLRVFDLFHRATRGDGAPAGTGMGLAIVKGLVEAHGGTVAALPAPGGHGAALQLTLPLAERTAAAVGEGPVEGPVDGTGEASGDAGDGGGATGGEGEA
jgi:two-component system sensor histidine kinase KdpD